jgi:hypothetical protein
MTHNELREYYPTYDFEKCDDCMKRKPEWFNESRRNNMNLNCMWISREHIIPPDLKESMDWYENKDGSNIGILSSSIVTLDELRNKMCCCKGFDNGIKIATANGCGKTSDDAIPSLFRRGRINFHQFDNCDKEKVDKIHEELFGKELFDKKPFDKESFDKFKKNIIEQHTVEQQTVEQHTVEQQTVEQQTVYDDLPELIDISESFEQVD